MLRIPYTFLFTVILLCAGCNKDSSSSTKDYPQDPLENLKARALDTLVFVEGGTFMMGDVGYEDEAGQFHYFTNDADVHPAHSVTLSSYSIQAYEVTFDDFDFYMQSLGNDIVDKKIRPHVEHLNGQYPAQRMTWYQARAYCQWLGQYIGQPMDLPTEAQWEYAARSRGLAVAHATNNGDIEYGVNYRDPRTKIMEMHVGSWPPNPLGLYDMTGNVNEWMLDLWHAYSEEPKVDPNFGDPESNPYTQARMRRGAGVIGGKGQIQLYRRAPREPEKPGDIGIRCVANVSEPIQEKN